MSHALLVDAIIDVFPSPNLIKHPGKWYYVSIRDTHSILTANAASIKSPRGGGQNGHLGLVLMATQCAFVGQVPFV